MTYLAIVEARQLAEDQVGTLKEALRLRREKIDKARKEKEAAARNQDRGDQKE